ncbi:hypothetical protein X769_18245 [Mesorhizobium sp. LSJC268A00]|uniref:hypothetical protein n=1 Tax=unclassified Mesorhizobium TaxID=325217 RepID=UPI0003CE0625|nr:hypothetical protein [Mesorhizobium sp. LSJC268A00]ESX03406.1 hypothetical protein X769_18245 [Mesorhizobium sp. LSJC268A00]
MAKRSLNLGGTLGALYPSGSLAADLAVQFTFDADALAQINDLAPPTQEWLALQRDITFDENYGPEQAFTMVARRFLRRKIERISRAEQSDYLRALDANLTTLMHLLVAYPQFNHTAADPLKFLEELARRQGKPARRRDQILSDLAAPLMELRAFAKVHLHSLGNEPKEQPEAIRRRKEFPRLVLIADIIATYQRVTGQEPMATASDDGHLHPAVKLVTVLGPPVLKAARVVKTQINPQTARIEIATVKRLWAEGRRPEQAGVLSSWAELG